MNEYTASNATVVEEIAEDELFLSNEELAQDVELDAWMVTALREFFRAEEDERLGRWRWPKDPDYIVYAEANGIHVVLRESTGESTGRNGLYVHDMEGEAAADYRDAHPEPKPWHEAKEDEVWALTIGPNENAYVLKYDWFERAGNETKGIRRDSTGITAGRRVWPES